MTLILICAACLISCSERKNSSLVGGALLKEFSGKLSLDVDEEGNSPGKEQSSSVLAMVDALHESRILARFADVCHRFSLCFDFDSDFVQYSLYDDCVMNYQLMRMFTHYFINRMKLS